MSYIYIMRCEQKEVHGGGCKTTPRRPTKPKVDNEVWGHRGQNQRQNSRTVMLYSIRFVCFFFFWQFMLECWMFGGLQARAERELGRRKWKNGEGMRESCETKQSSKESYRHESGSGKKKKEKRPLHWRAQKVKAPDTRFERQERLPRVVLSHRVESWKPAVVFRRHSLRAFLSLIGATRSGDSQHTALYAKAQHRFFYRRARQPCRSNRKTDVQPSGETLTILFFLFFGDNNLNIRTLAQTKPTTNKDETHINTQSESYKWNEKQKWKWKKKSI